MYRIRFLFVIALCSFSPCLFSAAPKWLKDPSAVYPSSAYLKAVGEGNSIEVAQNSAVASISLVFQTKTDVRTKAVKELSYIEEENKSEYATSQNAVQVVNISSDAEFLCTKFDEPYFDKKGKKYAVIAYVNKEEAFTVYNERITHLMNLIKKLNSIADSDGEVFRVVSNYQKALALGELVEAYIKNAIIVKPSAADSFSSDMELLESIAGKLAERKADLVFTVSSNDERCISVENHLISLLEEKGFACSETGYRYTIDMNVHFAEEHLAAGEFVRPTIRIQVKNADNKSIKSYSKAYTRYGAKTMETAYTRTMLKIQEDLTENFLSEFQ